jgi:predicted ribosomally synthesized peptide with SipW-like signal peptide
MKRIISGGVMLVALLALVAGGTGAFFSDTETSTGNVFTAGSIDLKVDHTKAYYNGEPCSEKCVEGVNNLVVNGGFETPALGNGAYAIYPNGSQTSWQVEAGPGLEIQRNAAGAPHTGNQLAELDSTGKSTISQTLTTVAGQKYRFSFWHSPRPNVPSGDNTIGYEVEVTSGPTTLISGTVGATSTGPSTSWTKYTYEFTAISTSTKIVFEDQGSANNTYGGYIDDVEVRTLTCNSYTETPGGYCQLWESKDLVNERFFDFADVKPQDTGSNLISLTVSSNEAYMCLSVAKKQDKENTLIDPETEAGDIAGPAGEMGDYLMVAGWYSDVNGNKSSLMFGPTDIKDLGSITYADSATGTPMLPNVTKYVHLEWCMGNMTLSGNTATCNGNVPNINQSQTDAFLADLQFYAVQTRNNGTFKCSSLPVPEYSNGNDID